MHLNRGTDAPPKAYGKHDAWNTPCNGWWNEDFDFDADPLEYVGRHRWPQSDITQYRRDGTVHWSPWHSCWRIWDGIGGQDL